MAKAKPKTSSKKTAAKKTTAKKPTAKATTKKPAAKKTATKKPTSKAKPKTTAAALKLPSAATRRPDQNLPPTEETVTMITNDLIYLLEYLNQYAANLRALDRQRHNGVGIKRLGFIEAAFRLSSKFPQYFPHWLNTAKFQSDLDFFNAVRSMVEVCRSIEEKAWNINVEAADMVYTDALEYYSQVQDAAERRIDSAESIYNELHGFFRHGSRNGEEPTEKQIKRDVNSLLHGRKDGEVVIKNVKPKVSGGKHEVIDETFRNSAAFKDTEEASFKG